jgi:gliding motility-associated-like protein
VPFSNSYVINEPTDIIVTTSSTPVDCFNGNNGTATVTAVGGVLPYSFFWNSSGFVTSSLNNLPEGSYFVTVTDANGCPSIAPVVVLQPANTLSGSIIPTDVSCYSLTDGMATVNPTGGTAPYGYFWSNGQTTQTATGLSAGIYTCIITDANGCVNTLNTLINEPNEILAGLNTIPASCYGFNDGAASVNPNGGTSPYTYLWSNSSTNTSIQNLSIGSYSVAVTDVDGCGTTSSPVIFTISQADSLTLTTSSTSVSCFNGNNGTANVIVSGGTPNYNYTWLDILGNTISTNSIANGLISDSFSVIVSDLNGCSDTALVLISSASELLTNISTSPATCFEGDDGSAIASPSGGTPPYNYLWIGGQSSSNTLEYTGLNSATTYYFSLQDANACSIFNDSVNISEPLAISMSFDVLDVNCFGGSDGEVIVHASGGTSPYEFSYQNILFTTDSIFTNLNAGWFNAYLVDANGCLSSDSIEVISPLVIDPNIFPLNSLTCSGGNDGHLASAAQGGVSPYTYFWSTFSNNYEILALSEGSYTVNVTDNNGCVASETFILSPDFEITSSTSTTLVSCIGASDGTAIIQASGGTSPYFYSWNDGSINFSTNDTIIGLSPGLYACVITDANGCIGYDTINIIESTTSLVIDSSLTNSVSCFAGSDGSAIVYASGGIGNYTYQWDDINLQTSQQAVGLTIGTFIVTITDSALCTVTETVIISEPLQLDITIIESDISCYGFLDGTLISSVVGGTGPYILSWVGPNLYTNSLSTIENLATGSYTLTVTDNNACQDTVSSLISEPTPLSFTTDVTNPSCYNDADGIIDIQISGGIQPYNAIYLSGNNSYPNANSIIISGLSVGSDTLYVTDLNGCQKTSFITLLQPLALQISNITEVDPTCYNYNDGSVSIVVTGGNLPYTYQLLDENGINIGMTSNTNGLADGIYTYIVNDLNGCTDSSQFSITIPDQIAITQLQSCYGSILLEISSFNSNYQIFWDNAPDSVFIADLSSGTYNATVIDSLGCTNTESFIVNDPFSFTIYDATCFSVSDGSIMLENLNGGFPPYSLSVNNELVFDNILGEILLDNLPVTNYQLLLTDNGGCTILDSLLVVNYIGGSNCVNTPIIISPNSDGTNDTWKPASDIDEEISVTIYNRWGQIEFFAKENSQILEWDGTTTEGRFLPTADYYFVIHFINQYTMPDKTGVITLIR